VGSSTGDFKIWLKGALGVECLSLWELVKGTWREGSLAGEGSSTGDFERCMKGAVWMKSLSL
jgi:hypothetical protein